ncbi:hypothetical protein QR680_018750 [Steinernema hermaphroditum]|uniref:26S proteasome non-ATPase regulatory subunit 2 n=1 Tax=Steinernema hermaphroditum TaxID=289476 RepID=A0AA39HJU5_9BILA|nr:hypothetical protein QR680_018750 [Steinernema hermaphroditum]
MATETQTPAKKDAPVRKEELSDEDRKLRDDLTALVERLADSNADAHLTSLEAMKTHIRDSTTSMTAVPKPLKFLRTHYPKLKEAFQKMKVGPVKQRCADIISVIAMVAGDSGDCINYRLQGLNEPIQNWGHEYVRHLTMGMPDVWKVAANDERRQALLVLVKEIVAYCMKHNAEVDACDLLVEIERLKLLEEFVVEAEYERVCRYLLSLAPLTPAPDNHLLIRSAKDVYMKFGKSFEALRCAIMLNDVPLCRKIFLECKDGLVQKQMAILLGRHQIFLELENMENAEKLIELNTNANLHNYFMSLGRELDVMEPKTPEDVYKRHVEPNYRPSAPSANDTSRMNLADAFVNGFVNCGFGVDKMMTDTDSANKWFYKNKEYGMTSAAASQGLVWRWNIEAGLAQCDRFLYVNDDFIKAGTLLAIGIVSSGIQDTCDPASALLLDYVHSERVPMRIGAVFGLGLAYANSKRQTVLKEEDGGVVHELKKVFSCTKASATMELKGLAALSLGFILVGSADHDTAAVLLQCLMEKNATALADPNVRFVALGIALIFLGTQEKSEVFVEGLRCLPEPFGSMISTLVDVCAYAGTGNVLKIQSLLHLCAEHYEPKEETKKKKSSGAQAAPSPPVPQPNDHSMKQAVAVLGIGLIAMGEEIGNQMCQRAFGHLARYAEPNIRRAVPLALGLANVSNPQINVMETLSKMSHDNDDEMARNAIFALGLVGAGTNHSRIVRMLRQLVAFYRNDSMSTMLVRIAQGLIHLGKGTMTLSPYHSDRQLMCPAAVASLFATCFAFLDSKNTILNGRQHYLLYSLVPAMQPRHVITVIEDENKPDNLKQINVAVRVGQAVDVIGQAGKPKTITGFQTFNTPVLLTYGDRAELATDEYLPLSPCLEGIVILKKNPEYDAGRPTKAKK